MVRAAPKLDIELRAVVYREDAAFIAHCLELDIVAEGRTAPAAVKTLRELCKLQLDVALEEGDVESVFRPAPPNVWKMFFLSKQIAASSRTAGLIHRFETREMALN